MNSNFLKPFIAAFAILVCFTASAQTGMEESFHANGSIRVVVAVSAIVMTGLLFFVLRLDRRLKKLEKKHNPEK